ncbi:MAG: capsular biosynthesis protein [Chitinophagaceae bacterium]|nr:capsular biosynthesis protein [Chitinophagaceae bacterium]
MKRICIDLDGVICTLKRPDETYADVQPLPGAAEKIRELRANGHYVIIQTARHMKTCNGNVGLVVQRIGSITLKWLADNNIEYDEIYFGKPWAELYIDDNALRFSAWDVVAGDGSNLPRSTESMKLNNPES